MKDAFALAIIRFWKRPQDCEHTGEETRSVIKREINVLVIDIFANWIRKTQMTIKQMKNTYIYNNNNIFIIIQNRFLILPVQKQQY